MRRRGIGTRHRDPVAARPGRAPRSHWLAGAESCRRARCGIRPRGSPGQLKRCMSNCGLRSAVSAGRSSRASGERRCPGIRARPPVSAGGPPRESIGRGQSRWPLRTRMTRSNDELRSGTCSPAASTSGKWRSNPAGGGERFGAGRRWNLRRSGVRPDGQATPIRSRSRIPARRRELLPSLRATAPVTPEHSRFPGGIRLCPTPSASVGPADCVRFPVGTIAADGVDHALYVEA